MLLEGGLLTDTRPMYAHFHNRYWWFFSLLSRFGIENGPVASCVVWRKLHIGHQSMLLGPFEAVTLALIPRPPLSGGDREAYSGMGSSSIPGYSGCAP